MRRSMHEAQRARAIRETSTDVRLAILHRIEDLVGSANPVAVEHLANAYKAVADPEPPTPPRLVDLRSPASPAPPRET